MGVKAPPSHNHLITWRDKMEKTAVDEMRLSIHMLGFDVSKATDETIVSAVGEIGSEVYLGTEAVEATHKVLSKYFKEI
jgi:hypothetical protein